MTDKSSKINLLFYFAILILFSSCVTLSSHQLAQTTPKGSHQISTSIDYYSNDLNFSDDEIKYQNIHIPSIEIRYRYGLLKRSDIGVSYNSWNGIALDYKINVCSPDSTGLFISTGVGIKFYHPFFQELSSQHIMFPVYLTYSTKYLDFYLNPRYFTSLGEDPVFDDQKVNISGFNFGIYKKGKVDFGLDFGFYNLKKVKVDEDVFILTTGIGVMYNF